MSNPRLGIIGGSGLYALEHLNGVREEPVETPFGMPSDVPRTGVIGGADVVFISRHGAGHRWSASDLPYAANICAMKMLGVSHVVSISAVGSLKEEIAPRSIVVPDNTIDRTHRWPRTFFDDGVVAHVSMANPFCPSLSSDLIEAARVGGLPVHTGGAYVCIEGPQFSTIAESELYRSWGASIIGMTALPEARLAREAELCYACLAMVSDYDVWHETEEDVTVDAVLENLAAMTNALQTIVIELASTVAGSCEHGCRHALANAIITAPDAIPAEAIERLQPIAGKYLPGAGSTT